MDRIRFRAGMVTAFLLAVGSIVTGCGGGKTSTPPPPVTEENRVEAEAAPPGNTSAPTEQDFQRIPEVDQYRILVNDRLSISVLGYPELSQTVRVLPDGTITLPGVGTLFVLGRVAQDLSTEIEERMKAVARYPQVTVSVVDFGERKLFVLGEVQAPGSQNYQPNMTILGAIAQAGGFQNSAKRSSVLLLRRTGPQEAVAHRLDLTGPLKGDSFASDVTVQPYDIVYVPKTFIASAGVLMEQYFQPFIAPFSLYTEGWQAFHMDDATIRLVP